VHLLTQMLNDAGVATEVCTDPTTSVCMNLNQLTDWLLESAHGPIRITGMINIKVREQSQTMDLVIRPTATGAELKTFMQRSRGLPVKHQHWYGLNTSIELSDSQTLAEYGLTDDSVLSDGLDLEPVVATVKLQGSVGLDLVDRSHHQQYARADPDVVLLRGGSPYDRPGAGWFKMALNISGRYGESVWLSGSEPRKSENDSAPGEWPVAYHGPSLHNGRSMGQTGPDLVKGAIKSYETHLGGVWYMTPRLKAAQRFASRVQVGGANYKLVVQCRVNPRALTMVPKEVTGSDDMWIIKSRSDIRPYALCVKRC